MRSGPALTATSGWGARCSWYCSPACCRRQSPAAAAPAAARQGQQRQWRRQQQRIEAARAAMRRNPSSSSSSSSSWKSLRVCGPQVPTAWQQQCSGCSSSRLQRTCPRCSAMPATGGWQGRRAGAAQGAAGLCCRRQRWKPFHSISSALPTLCPASRMLMQGFLPC